MLFLGELRIQDYPEIFDRLITVQSNFKGKRSKESSFLFLVNMMSWVLSRLADKPVSPHQVCTVWRAHCMSRDDPVFGNFPIAKRNVISVTLSIYSDPIQHRYQIINEVPQEWQQRAFLWSTGHHNPSEWIIKGRRGQVALHGSFKPPDSGVAKPMSDKSITHGVKRGVVKTPIAVSCWLSTFSTRTTSWWRAVYMDFWVWSAYWLGCSGIRARAPSLYPPASAWS